MTNSDKKPPTVAAMCLFKNEAMIMEEYIRHHAAEGITEFVLINDGSTDNGPSIAKHLADKLKLAVTIIPASSKPVRSSQKDMMTAALKAVSADWLARIDIDEFLYTESGNIPEYLAQLSEDVTKVHIEWQMFSSEGAYYKQPKSLINSYIHTATNGRGKKKKKWGSPHKTIGKTSEITEVGVHNIYTRSGTSLLVNIEEHEKDQPNIRMNHYRSQSREYFFRVQIPRT